MSKIVKQDTNGVKPLLGKGELGYDAYTAGGDEGRVWVGTGTTNIAQAKKSEVDLKAPIASPTFTGTVSGVSKAMVGLGNVDNTSDLNKPISTATQTALNLKVDESREGQANGIATLGADAKVPASQLPSYVDDVVEYANLAGFPGTGETGKIYVALDTNKAYRWSGSAYIYITSGAVDSVAGKTGVVTLVKADVGLSNVDNTSDVNKPISTAVQTYFNNRNFGRADKYLAAQNIANMIYTAGELTKIRYNNNTDVDYEVLNYSGGNLVSINHYVGGVLQGTTTLSYTSGNLVSAVFA